MTVYIVKEFLAEGCKGFKGLAPIFSPQGAQIRGIPFSQFVTEIMDNFPSILVMYLFGSHAAGTNRTDSDADIAVFTDGSESPLMDLDLGAFLQLRLSRAVDVVILQKASPILQHEVLRNKIRIFEKSGINRAFLENESLRAYLDARYYQRMRALWRKSDDKIAGHLPFAE